MEPKNNSEPNTPVDNKNGDNETKQNPPVEEVQQPTRILIPDNDAERLELIVNQFILFNICDWSFCALFSATSMDFQKS